jgi:lipoate-protein ligase A
MTRNPLLPPRIPNRADAVKKTKKISGVAAAYVNGRFLASAAAKSQ